VLSGDEYFMILYSCSLRHFDTISACDRRRDERANMLTMAITVHCIALLSNWNKITRYRNKRQIMIEVCDNQIVKCDIKILVVWFPLETLRWWSVYGTEPDRKVGWAEQSDECESENGRGWEVGDLNRKVSDQVKSSCLNKNKWQSHKYYMPISCNAEEQSSQFRNFRSPHSCSDWTAATSFFRIMVAVCW